ncbi:hypothetical protein LMG28727_05706 [Paraburkholderia kirstenboschensis]|nr:hypothetical protein LMG28727_05706 [Paraburkholderia kirstenboschensis]
MEHFFRLGTTTPSSTGAPNYGDVSRQRLFDQCQGEIAVGSHDLCG